MNDQRRVRLDGERDRRGDGNRVGRVGTVEERFWRRVAKGDGCWTWTGRRHRKGYGEFWIHGDVGGAHRASWVLHNGPIPAGMCVLHTCDNPPCVNPTHLFLGTVADNNHDAIAKGRNAQGERNGQSKLTADGVREIRRIVADGYDGTYEALGRRFGVTGQMVSLIVAGRYWKHVTPATPAVAAPAPADPTGGRCATAPFTPLSPRAVAMEARRA